MATEDWTVECSDDEMKKDIFMVKNERIWEPNGDKIAQLYEKLTKDKVMSLKWINPGRRSPAVESNENAEKGKGEEEYETAIKSENTLFDFDEDFGGGGSAGGDVAVPKIKRKINTCQKQVTQLDKVMSDMKKYQSKDNAT